MGWRSHNLLFSCRVNNPAQQLGAPQVEATREKCSGLPLGERLLQLAEDDVVEAKKERRFTIGARHLVRHDTLGAGSPTLGGPCPSGGGA